MRYIFLSITLIKFWVITSIGDNVEKKTVSINILGFMQQRLVLDYLKEKKILEDYYVASKVAKKAWKPSSHSGQKQEKLSSRPNHRQNHSRGPIRWSYYPTHRLSNHTWALSIVVVASDTILQCFSSWVARLQVPSPRWVHLIYCLVMHRHASSRFWLLAYHSGDDIWLSLGSIWRRNLQTNGGVQLLWIKKKYYIGLSYSAFRNCELLQLPFIPL